MTDAPGNRKQALDALDWQLSQGIDEAVSETPVNRFETPSEDLKPVPPEKPVTPEPPPKRVQGFEAKPQAHGKAESDAESVAAAAKTLEDLEKAVEGFEGCALKRTAMNTVFSRGNPDAGLMLVGEAPGADEDRQGKPFVGASGHLLDRMMAAIGRPGEDQYYISNIIPWRPPGNRNPTPQEVAICLPFIKRHIELVDPKVLVLLGGVAVKSLLDITDGITRVRGRWFTYPAGKKSIPAMATFHPAYLLRQPQLKKQSWQDLLEIKAKLES